jgi:hypothetical protein
MTKTPVDVETEISPLIHDAIAAMTVLKVYIENNITEIDKDVAPGKELATLFFRIKEANGLLETSRKAVGNFSALMERNLLPHVLERMGVDMIRVPEIARSFSIQQKVSASMIDRTKGLQWLRANDLGDLVTETVNAGTLSSSVRRMIIDQGIEPPDDIFKVTTYNSIGIAKYNPK